MSSNVPDSVRKIIDGIIGREGDGKGEAQKADRGGATRWGITEKTARAAGYTGEMRDLPRETAFDILLNQYFIKPGFAKVAELSPEIAEELTDTATLMGQAKPAFYLQRVLNAFNDNAALFPDLEVDGKLGTVTLEALRKYLAMRRTQDGVAVMLVALNAFQAVDLLSIAERDHTQERFVFGWLRNRVLPY